MSPSQVLLDLAKISDLLDNAECHGLPNVKKTMLKHENKNIFIQFFLQEEIFISSDFAHQDLFAVERIRNLKLC